jgi:UDP-N-acetylmuramoyl-tripeptide--D-alanyl-D-alanine ligase
MLTLQQIVEALVGEQQFSSSQIISDIVIDSRCAVPGSLFVAFAGEKSDGHEFAADAFSRGAVAALIERPVPGDHSTVDLALPSAREGLADLTLPVCFLVGNTLTAIQQLAAFWRRRFTPRVIGITGRVGKTTTKELVHAVLDTRYRTLKSEGNLNNEIGLPLTLLRLDKTYERVVVEMGMYALGEISTLARIARPQVGVVTNIGPVHLERLGSIQAIADAKAELVEALPADGVAILNQDEPLVRAMADRTPARVFTYGLSPKADLWADGIEGAGLEGIRFTLHYRGETIHIRAPLLGRHSVHTALRAAAVGLVEGLDWSDIIGGLRSDSPQLRLVVVKGPNESLLLDDTYNASPASTIAALNLLAELENRRVAVLGDMLELGSYEEAGHRLVGRRVVDVANLLVTVGKLGQITAEEALAMGMQSDKVVILPDADAAIQVVPGLVRKRDMVLIKGSRGVGLDRLVDALARLAETEGQTLGCLPERKAV